MREYGGTGGYGTFLAPKKVPKKAACGVKVNWMKTGSGPGHPVAGESLNHPDESKLSSVRFLLSPLVWLRQPAPIASACHGGVVGCIGCSYLFASVG